MNYFPFPASFHRSLLLLLFSCLFIKRHAANEIDDVGKGGISVLTLENFESFVNDQNHYTLLVVYAPWCHWSSMLLADLKKISVLLKHDEQVKIATVNASANVGILERLNVHGYPSIFMINNVTTNRYMNIRSIKNIISWVYATLKDNTVYEIKNTDKLENYTEHDEYNNSIVFFVIRNNEDETLLKILIDMCLKVNTSYCFYIKENRVIDYLENVIMPKKNFSIGVDQQNKNMYTVIYKNNQFDEYFHMQREGLNLIYDLSVPYEERLKILKNFILESIEPLVIQFSEIYYNLLFVPDVVTLFIIYNDQKDLNKTDIMNSAKRYKSKIIFCISGSKEVFEKRLLSELIIENVDRPLMRIIEFKENVDIPLKYKPISDDIEINEKNIDEFIEGYFNGRKYFYRRSERPLPEEINNGYVKIIVADTYDEYIFKNDKHILVLYYAPWCGHCRKFEPIYRELGKRLSIYSAKFKDYNNDIIISKIDAANNEIYNISINGYPSLYLYEKSNKANPIKYTGTRTVQDIISWVSEKTSSNLNVSKLLSLSLDEEQLFENYEEL